MAPALFFSKVMAVNISGQCTPRADKLLSTRKGERSQSTLNLRIQELLKIVSPADMVN
jgi:hypothetical protein